MPVGSTAKTKVYLMKLNCKSYVFVNPVESMQATLSASELNYIVPYAYGALYAYGTGKIPIRVRDIPYAYGLSHTRMGQNTRTGCNIAINKMLCHIFTVPQVNTLNVVNLVYLKLSLT